MCSLSKCNVQQKVNQIEVLLQHIIERIGSAEAEVVRTHAQTGSSVSGGERSISRHDNLINPAAFTPDVIDDKQKILASSCKGEKDIGTDLSICYKDMTEVLKKL